MDRPENGPTGPNSTRADGWHVTAKGYLRGRVDGRMRLAHDWVWEQHHGPIAIGYQVHHRDDDKQNNDIDNLQLVTPTEHKRLHSGCELRGAVWWKPCRLCGEHKPIDAGHWYISPEGWPLYGRCRVCHIRKVVEAKRLRRLRNRGGDA